MTEQQTHNFEDIEMTEQQANDFSDALNKSLEDDEHTDDDVMPAPYKHSFMNPQIDQQQPFNIEAIYARIRALDIREMSAAVNALPPNIRSEYYRYHQAAPARKRTELKAQRDAEREARKAEREGERAERERRKAKLKARRAAAMKDFQKRLDDRLRKISDGALQEITNAKGALAVERVRLTHEHSLQVKEIKRRAQEQRNSLTTRSWERFNEKYPSELAE